jgi:amidase
MTKTGSLKPSKERMPGREVSVPRSGSESVNAGLGPLAKSVDGLELWLKAQLASEPWNESTACLPMRWNGLEAQRPTKKLKIAVIWNDGIIQPTLLSR